LRQLEETRVTQDNFTGGASSSPVDWTTPGAWTTGEPPQVGYVVQASGYGIMNEGNFGAGGGPGEEILGGLTLTSGSELTVEGSMLVGGDEASFGGAGSVINVDGGDGGGLTVYSSVTSATGEVNVLTVTPWIGIGPVEGEYLYDGSGNVQTVYVGDNNASFTIDGSGNSPIVTLAAGGFTSGGTLVLEAANNTPTVNLDGGGMQITANNGGSINLAGGGQLMLGNSAVYSGVLSGLGAHDVLDVADSDELNAATHSINVAANTVTLEFTSPGATESYTLHFNPATMLVSNLSFTTGTGSWSPYSNFFVITLVCFCSGTRIRTIRGEVCVEDLAVGDLAVTASGAPRPIVWIGHRTIASPSTEQQPVRVRAGAFGEELPARDLRLSHGHAVCVDALGEVLIPVGELVNETTIVREEVAEVTYWHVELESHDVLLAEGLACESYLDTGNRAFFGRVYGRLPRIDCDRTLADSCRPFMADGPIVAAIRDRLASRADAICRAAPEREVA
jgi:hypothetical protein